MAFEYKEEYKYLTNICLNLTDACNFACRYCFVEQHPHYMTYEVAKKAVDFVLENLEKKRKIKNDPKLKAAITYFGGEPTLMWDEIIFPLTTYIRKNKLPINLAMTTNTSLLNEEKIKWLGENKVNLLLSMDGDRETQCYNRPTRNPEQNSFEMVEKNIPALLESFPNITFRATIYAPTSHKTFENFMFAVNKGFKYIFMIPDSRHPWTEEEKIILKQELDKIFSFYSYCFSNNIEPPIQFRLMTRSYEHILKRDKAVLTGKSTVKETTHNVQRCGLGTGLGSIGYEGNIYGCQEQTSKNTESFFYIGNIFNGGIDQELHEKLLKTYYAPAIQKCVKEELCSTCPLRAICYSLCCPSTSWDLYNNFFIDSEIHCLWQQWTFNNSAYMMNKLVKADNQVFKKYLYKTCKYEELFNKK